MVKILTPFRYCEFQEADRSCYALAGVIIHGLSVCERHAGIIDDQLALLSDAVELVTEEEALGGNSNP